ncbi:hypothetical protein COZ61_00655 [Candidatus Berkelbacteria bacterium CG_4_8_14_3_um_filter_33_6]|uniref:Transposase IS200-like domain-containing protein n=1 Tax=Candidatus Berkelbacteria bacterium CG_4_10_14_0_2_um_filter_35_9_33_12 TaxID=1974499 RepID=A0A2M7W569_9BACT|nr:MAG: hypothetical protein COX10_00910 [Candidatus Berkelbacteria bacterium CG23_combo_of_CG06-09_8_20_14_all_33_15]PIS08578.1 MAG: hypothetical protein COT76_00650 [Candidatus Berkelbacteria bacterium CG10_big_fil_rev_8_21_14_0_10_33_10]PIX31260.1 MAG: hypothetical protein COZ61_00655 [Candidatus Berkelbacteria bacterium CG_4_8_14_3_um_filter_33_6]PIZ28009.1 MAG: hypothetical protein COY43_02875 [Candidatus Berkelbacteria bacterium CG_4_10_14_0_8_um_filter_35_9_33_8]PJA20632.1 MAG: hypotheti
MHVPGTCIFGKKYYNRIMGIRKVELSNEQYYHVFNRSIAKYEIFTSDREYQHFIYSLRYYLAPEAHLKMSRFTELSTKNQMKILNKRDRNNQPIDIICYCIMPTHFHLLVKQNKDFGVTNYLRLVQNSYSHYFNLKHKRSGPLWQGKFKNIQVKSDEQLLHLTRYIHLNPSNSILVDKPEEWLSSSYNEYLNSNEDLCTYKDIIDIDSSEYQNFVNDRKDYQRQLHLIKSTI